MKTPQSSNGQLGKKNDLGNHNWLDIGKTEQWAPEYWEEKNAPIMRIQSERYQVFGSGHDVGNRLRYPIGDPEAEFNHNASWRNWSTDAQWIWRSAQWHTHVRREIHLDRIPTMRNTPPCNFHRDRNNWRQVYERISETHFYPSRIPDVKWDIPRQEQTNNKPPRKNNH